MDGSPLSQLIQRCKSNDVDAKIDAVTKLQAEFEAGVEITDSDAVIQVLKACLRVSNQHLTTATLSALPPFLPLILSHAISRPAPVTGPASASASTSSAGSSSVDTYTLRQVILAFLSTGGIIDRLGDAKEKAREKARESLGLIGGFAFRSGGGSVMGRSKDGKNAETPLQMFERFFKEGGLTSKVWRVREQSILTLVDIRRAHHLFPIRPYLPILVGALEDSDSTVRESTRTAVVALFTGPGVTDAARADLKREMTKKGTRKTIVDSVLAKVLSGSGSTPASEGSENGDAVVAATAKKEYVPPSLALQGRRPTTTVDSAPGPSSMSRSVSHGNGRELSRPASRAANVVSPPPGDAPTTVQAVYIASSRDLENEFADMFKPFEGKETEHNWAGRDRAITRVRGMIKGDVHIRYTDTFLAHLKQIIDASYKTLASLRTIVATNTCTLYNELALALGSHLDPVCEGLLSHLLRMAGFTKKIAAQTSQATVDIIIQNTSAQPRTVIPLLWTTLQDKIVPARSYVVDHLKIYMEVHGTRSRNAIESTGMLDTLEKCVKKAMADANVAVRQNARICFWVFEGVWPDRGRAILEAQDTMSRKQLEKACPNPHALAAVPPITPPAKKTSVAAAIAASRAKAKAIATSPPTLRHQATSAARTISPPKRSTSPSLSTGSVSGGAASPVFGGGGSPTSPRSRIISNPNTISRTTSSRSVSHSRNSSADSAGSAPASPGDRRRPASPRVPLPASPPRGSVLRRAMQTALPSSPPATTVTPPTPSTRRFSGGRPPVPAVIRDSVHMPNFDAADDAGSLLTAVAIPLPDESDSDMEMDESTNLISFSTPYEKYPPVSASNSRTNSFSPRSEGFGPALPNTLSSGSPSAGLPTPIVEDVLRARAEQAQSAAERLLELVEPEDETAHPHAMSSSLLLKNGDATPTVKQSPMPVLLTKVVRPPVTPAGKNSAVWRQAAAFKDSPAYNGAPTLMTDVLRPLPPKTDSSWWRKRMALINQRNPLRRADAAGQAKELQGYITALDEGVADVSTLKGIALFCHAHPSMDPISPLSSGLSMPASPSPFLSNTVMMPALKSDIWVENKNFSRLFQALQKFLAPEREEELLTYGLIVLWEMMEYESLPMEGREADVFSILFRIRYSNKQTILEASNTIRDALTARVEAVYGLTTMHAVLLAFHAEPIPTSSPLETRASTYAYGLIALGKFILRLPAEILEEELPRLKNTLISALNDATSLVVREAAAAVIIAAQLILRDETHLFALIDGLADEKKNLLTYLFDKHGVRNAASGASAAPSLDRIEREMRRLDGRLGTPPRAPSVPTP
ncbi:hypothetical protein BV25DRAFT_1817959 [Artomyces pyxidatus]|uniref:Uncharacterized protein n=1 Tax=Artomyces pyxidatus TaxID=48021 RepID=A0ACB8TKU4_9AGAM|nr:hypothetical protein BV25DRAFT_1817959 [Artomyces pyxidatus]